MQWCGESPLCHSTADFLPGFFPPGSLVPRDAASLMIKLIPAIMGGNLMCSSTWQLEPSQQVKMLKGYCYPTAVKWCSWPPFRSPWSKHLRKWGTPLIPWKRWSEGNLLAFQDSNLDWDPALKSRITKSKLKTGLVSSNLLLVPPRDVFRIPARIKERKGLKRGKDEKGKRRTWMKTNGLWPLEKLSKDWQIQNRSVQVSFIPLIPCYQTHTHTQVDFLLSCKLMSNFQDTLRSPLCRPSFPYPLLYSWFHCNFEI